jgi:hypothetical protein
VRQLFILSPAKVSGVRARLLLNPKAPFATAKTFHRQGLPLGEVFSFASGLYFRGKLAYARHFADEARGDRIRVITTNRGLLDPDTLLKPSDLLAFGDVDIDQTDSRYLQPLRNDALALARELALGGQAILLGSIATGKYRDVLLSCFGKQLVFPQDFVGRGDMSRGGLLLRSTREDRELGYVAVEGAVFKGRRAPKISETG